jgi:uncharacterized protein (DUF924 family)
MAMKKTWVEDVLAYWFHELSEEDWFATKDAIDRAIRSRFGGLLAELRRGIPEEARTDPRTALAAIIVLDQFSRNIFRGTSDAFASDSLALDLARNALERDFDAGMSDREKQFLYMPFMHSEVLADQERCVQLFKALGNAENEKYAVEHRDIIAGFGRFPHRNAVLGRDSTAAEKAFLAGHKGFGQ